MRAGGKRSGHFLCFGAVDLEEEKAAVKTRESSARSYGRSEVLVPEARRHGRRLERRVLAKIFRSVMFVSALSRSRKEGKDPNRSMARKASDDKRAAEWSGKSSYGDDRTAVAIFSSSSWPSSSTSSSSCSSLASSSCISQPEHKPKPELRRKRASLILESRNHPPPARAPARSYSSATGLFLLLLLSLSVMVFCGRLYAILWTSSWLCFVPRRNSDAGLAAENVAATAAPKLRRKGLEENEKKRIILEGLLERNRRV